jgi:hypothetical protein
VILRINIGSEVREQANHPYVTIAGGEVYWCVTTVVMNIGVGAAIEQTACYPHVPVHRRCD